MATRTPRAAIVAARNCIAVLERGGAVGSADLAVVLTAAGENVELLMRRKTSGFMATCDVATAIAFFHDFIEDGEMELFAVCGEPE